MINIIEKIPENAKFILEELESKGYNSYIVGGCVRDLLLGREPNDFDILTDALPDDIERIFDNTIAIGKQFGVINVVLNGETYDVSTMRRDGEYSDGRHPDSVKFTRSLKGDLSRRDFTINSIAMNLNGTLFDFFNGREDLENKIIRCVGDMDVKFNEDSLRILRAFRFSAQLGFELNLEIRLNIHYQINLLKNISKERIRSEWDKILLHADINLLNNIVSKGIMNYISPDTIKSYYFEQCNPYHIHDVWKHTALSTTLIEKELIRKLIMFYHDIGKPSTFKKDGDKGRFIGHAAKSVELTRKNMKEFKYDNDTINKVCKVIEFHDYPLEPKKKAIKKLLNKMGEQYFNIWYDVKWADILSQNLIYAKERLEKLIKIKDLYNEIIKEKEVFTIKDLQITGKTIIGWGFAKEGKEVGEILNDILDKVINGELENNDIQGILQYLNYKMKM